VDEQLRDAVALLAGPGQVVEVRALADLTTHSGYFKDYEALVRQVKALGTDVTIQGIYITLNNVNPALFSRRANRIKMRLGKKDSSTGDADIVRRRWLPIDIDPLRPSGVSSTDEEHGLALAKADEIARWIAGLGFPDPVRADSGNGAHLLYRIDLPNDDAATALVKACLTTLSALFSDERVSVDTANFNAARIWKLYGTVSRKGDNTPERPHRRSCIISAPEVLKVVNLSQLQDLVARLPDERQAQPGGAKDTRFDLCNWLSDHGVGVRSEKPYSGGTLYILDQCPFSSAHKDGAFAIQFGNGAVFAGCKHTSCGGGTQRWQELREQFEPDRVAKVKDWEQKQKSYRKDRAQAKAAREDTAVPVPVNPDVQATALEVLEHGNPISLMLSVFAKEHVGDDILARCMLLSMASQAVKNSEGLHVSVTGDSGKGKTHAFKKMMQQVPDRYKVNGTVSNKALYYMKDLRPRTVLMSDDTELTDGIQEILKSATSNFNEPITHTTVTKDLTSRVCTIPERCVWWLSKKEGTGDDQVMNRMLTCWIDESPEQDTRVLASKQEKEGQDPDTFTGESPELAVCKEIWEILHEQLIWVIIPFSTRIRFQTISNRRNPDMLYDLIKSHTALFFMQREKKSGSDGTLCVYADESDFTAATEVFTLLNGTAGGQESKMTKKESDLLVTIEKAALTEFTIQDLQRLTGWSYSCIYRTIKGYECRGKNYTGLLEKCPALSFTDRTVTISEEQGHSVRRRTDAFQWDRELYRQWNGGGACWLDRDPKNWGGSFAALQQVFSTFAANAANEKNDVSGSISGNGTDIDNNSVLRYSALQHNENHGAPQQPGPDVTRCLHDSRNAANEDRSPPGAAQSPDIASQRVPIGCSICCKAAEKVLETPPSAAKQNTTIRAHDYKKLNSSEPKTACYVCGRKGSWYIEKYTTERQGRAKDQQEARRVCRSCFNDAVKVEQMASVPLPGTVVVSRCSRVTVDVGKCTVCGLVKAEWIDREAGVLLCEHCYVRGVREMARVFGVG
jgi:hypothetical protein